ncbi:glycine zipper 2TM domain-containing protein [Leeia sp. TBRC 13508]|uniref:Glycine zipper 2TM domain-containing protein n=1 Tax=Leeia speluncae TaxID=2884804 RepID=A0ABS8DA92_9NEIS|nr:glycine zipper 2TM domain-containing protein [Leeia speluncae]MCB6184841.1 glycine zipper 2TM domain-containing protein [Leeia speluncae]
MKRILLGLSILLAAGSVGAREISNSTWIGGAIGAGVGAVIGHDIGDRDGAILGAAIGGAAGAAIGSNSGRKTYREPERRIVYVEPARREPRYYVEERYIVVPKHDHGRHRGWYKNDYRYRQYRD